MTLNKLVRAACLIAILIDMLTNQPGWAIFFVLILRFWFSE